MEVGGDDVFIDHTFIAGLSGISQSVVDLSEGGMVSDIGAPAVVFKAHHRSVEQGAVEHDIANQTLRLPLGGDIQDGEPLDGLLLRFVIFAEKLVAPADSEDNAVVFYIALKSSRMSFK